jgi:hypothetical protein
MQSRVVAKRAYKRRLVRFSCACGHEQTESTTEAEHTTGEEQAYLRTQRDKKYKPNADEGFEEARSLKEIREATGDLYSDGDNTWVDPLQSD